MNSNKIPEKEEELLPSDEENVTEIRNKEETDSEIAPSETKQNETNENDVSSKVSSVPKLSTRLEFLSRPKRDILDEYFDTRIDGALPEKSLATWVHLPLQNKIPYDRCPIPVTGKAVATNLFLPPLKGKEFDHFDQENKLLPTVGYKSLRDPQLKDYFLQKRIGQHLEEEGYVSTSGRVIGTLADINHYRCYQRRILAADVQQKFKEDQMAIKKARRKEKERIEKKEKEAFEDISQGQARNWIKNAVSKNTVRSMENQKKRDLNVIAAVARQQAGRKESLRAHHERCQKILSERRTKKELDEKMKPKIHLQLAKRDLQGVSELCKKVELWKLDRKRKNAEFWERKNAYQEKWYNETKELEKERKKEFLENVQKRIFASKGLVPKDEEKEIGTSDQREIEDQQTRNVSKSSMKSEEQNQEQE